MSNRVLKDSIRTSRSVNSLTDFQFRVWVYLITYADDFGRGSADPELLKGIVFTRRKGMTEQQISKALDDLANMGMINIYAVDGESFFCFPNWSKHQRIQKKVSKFPAPPNQDEVHGDSPYITVSHRLNTESRIQNPESEITTSRNVRVCAEIPTDENVSAVVTDFLDRINPMASSTCLEELSEYAKSLGKAVCLRAFDIALDEKKTNWLYIRGILRNCASKGITCLADWEGEENKRAKKNGTEKSGGFEYEYGNMEGSL